MAAKKTAPKSSPAKKPVGKASAKPKTESKAAKSPVTKKTLKGKKLEERIAPGMLGGGLVDPGMTDSEQTDSQTEATSYQETQTEVDSSNNYIGDEGAETGTYSEGTSTLTSDDGFTQPEGETIVGATEYGTFDNSEAPNGDYMVSYDSWQEPDWVTANADGSFHVQPPEGVEISDGIANFPMDVANEELPMPENIEIQADGTVEVAMPEGTTYNEEMNALIMPEGTVEIKDIPQEFGAFENPDGTVQVPLPESGCEWSADANTLTLSNELVNEIAPPYMDINTDGSVNVALPEGTQINADGSLDIPSDIVNQFDNPPPEYVQQTEWAEVQSDGSVVCEPPQGTMLEDGIAQFPHDVVDELPIPDDVTINADGTIDVKVPQGCEYNAEAGTLTFPDGKFSPDDCPQGINYFSNPDGTYSVVLPEGMAYNEDTGAVHMDNYWANQFAPDPVHINVDGSIAVELPQGTEIQNDGTFVVPAEQTAFLEQPCPSYVHDATFAEPLPGGDYQVTPPQGVTVNEGTMHFNSDAVETSMPTPNDVTINADGTFDVKVPEGTIYSAEGNFLTFPEGKVHLDEIPEGVQAHVNPDGTVTAYLPGGMQWNDETQTVHMANYWANEFAPPHVDIHPDGSVDVALPANVNYQPDGSLIIPAESADFMESPDPGYVSLGPDWVQSNPDGSITIEAPKDVVINTNEGTLTMSGETCEEHFENYMPEDMQFNPDGSMDVVVPEGTQWNAAEGVLTLPATEVHPSDIPAGISYEVQDNGNIAVTLPEGISFDPAEGTVHFDNYWANQVLPEPVSLEPNGQIVVDMPPACNYADGYVQIPPEHADFMENPAPAYCYNGPEWVEVSPNGGIEAQLPTDVKYVEGTGQINMSVDSMNEHFEEHIPDDVTFNPDGTVNIELPNGTTFNAETGTLTFPAETVHINEIPPQVNPVLNADGSINVTLPAGITYDAASNTVHLDNYWTNELAPAPMEVTDQGQVYVQLPDGHYYNDGQCNLPPEQADFMNAPQPEYVAEGPAWVDGNPDGSVTVTPPDGFEVDAQAGTFSADIETFKAEFESYIPDEIQLNADGTADIRVPQGTMWDGGTGTLTFPAGTVHMNDLPPGVEATYSDNGYLQVELPEGISFDSASQTVHFDNEWLNKLAPEPLDFGTDGTVTINLPEGTQYFDNGAFVIPPDQANFMDGGNHSGGEYETSSTYAPAAE